MSEDTKMTEDQRKRDEEAAAKVAQGMMGGGPTYRLGFYDGLAHCRDTEVKELKKRMKLLEEIAEHSQTLCELPDSTMAYEKLERALEKYKAKNDER